LVTQADHHRGQPIGEQGALVQPVSLNERCDHRQSNEQMMALLFLLLAAGYRRAVSLLIKAPSVNLRLFRHLLVLTELRGITQIRYFITHPAEDRC
jgi:hypothetical protein